MSGSGQERPRRIEDLIDSRLMARLDRLDLRTRKMFPGKLQGERRSKKRGQSVEFDDFRNYVPGDDLRFIDWNVYARLDRLIVKIFLEEEDLALHIALDASTSMDSGRPNKLHYAARLALALAYVGLTKQNRVALSIFGLPEAAGGGFQRLGDLRGRRHFQRLGAFLIDAIWSDEAVRARSMAGAPGVGGAFSDAMTTIARHRLGKGVMVILSDALAPEGYENGLRNLAASGGYDTLLLQTLSPGEIDPSVETDHGFTGDLRLVDAETGRPSEVTITAALVKKYRERLQAYCDNLGAYCVAREIGHVLVRTDTPPESLLMETLRRRGVLG